MYVTIGQDEGGRTPICQQCFHSGYGGDQIEMCMQDTVHQRQTFVVLDAAAIDFVDSTGLEALRHLLFQAPKHVHIMLADLNRTLLDTLEQDGDLQKLGEHIYFLLLPSNWLVCRDHGKRLQALSGTQEIVSCVEAITM